MKRLGDRGYTLIELIVSMTIFSVVIVIAVGAFVRVQHVSQKTTAQRRVEQDARFNLEQLARQIRSSKIDYNFYTLNANNPVCVVNSVTGSTKVLALLVTQAGTGGTPTTKRIFYYYKTPSVVGGVTVPGQVWTITMSDLTATPSCDAVINPLASTSGRQVAQQNADTVNVTALQFYVNPVSDPYIPKAQPVPIENNTHPRVTVVWSASIGTSGGNLTQQVNYSAATFEMTISSRAYPTSTTYGQPT